MPSKGLVRCDCNLCLQDNPLGCEISAVMRSRHRKDQAANTSLGLLAEAERAMAAELVLQALPSILTSGAESTPLSTQTVQGNTAAADGSPTRTSEGHGRLNSREGRRNLLEYNSTIHSISLSIIREASSISRPTTLQFLVDPCLDQERWWELIHDEIRLPTAVAQSHRYHFVLQPSHINQEFIRSESVLREALDQVDTLVSLLGSRTEETADVLDSAHSARQVAADALSQLMTWKQAIWMERAASRATGEPCVNEASNVVDTGRFLFPDPANHDHHPLVLSSAVHTVLSNLVFGMPVKGCETLLDGFRYSAQLAVSYSQGALPLSLPSRIPKTLAGAFQHLDLNPTLRQYIVCDKCHSLSPAIQPYPPRCRNRPVPGEPGCQSPLLMERRINGRVGYVPIKTYLHQDFRMWLGRFLCRPGIEVIIKESQRAAAITEDGAVTDILGSRAIRGFKGVDNLPFLRPVDGQYRLLFALSADGFNPLTNKVAKQVRTSTGIYLICLNLPLALRQLPHNMYLAGVVPGPSKPKEGELNHYLNLVVDDFEVFWDLGVVYTSTALNKGATLCFAAIVPIICDALGAREVSGFPTITSAQFCIYCGLPLCEIENLDSSTWPKRTCEDHRRLAEEWRVAPLATRLEMQKASHPARYSSLLRLSYFDPLRFTVIDTMHLLYLGLFERHCRSVWGMNVNLEDGDGSKRGLGAIPPPPIQEDMNLGRSILTSGNPDEFSRRSVRKDVLYYLCEENGLRTGGKKRDLINELRTIMSRPNEATAQSPSTVNGVEASSNHPTISPPAKKSLSTRDIPTITAKVKEEFPLVEARLAKKLSLQKCHVEPLRIMCYLRGLVFDSQRPVKKEMISALLYWRAEQASLYQWVPTMHVSQLDTLALAQAAQTQGQNEGASEATRLANPLISGRGRASQTGGNRATGIPTKPRRSKRSQSVVLGSGVMAEYVVDRSNMVLPSWITAPPSRAGHANHGKMSADQWRMFCTVNLPVTLIRIWSPRQSEPRWNAMLLNFLDLVIAVEIASLVSTTDSLVMDYEKFMRRYLTSLKSVYKDAPLVQNQHIALHVGETMREFGPPPGYRTFGTERFNYTLQRVKTNRHEFGQIEMTMTRSVCRASNLTALLEHPDALPQHLRGTVSRALKDDERGTRVHDVPVDDTGGVATGVPQYANPTQGQSRLSTVMLDALVAYLNLGGPKYVPHTVACKKASQIFVYPDVTFLRVLRVGGASYRPSTRSIGSSMVLVGTGGRSQRPAQILSMFRHARDGMEGMQEDVFVAVRFFQPLDDNDKKSDPYRAVNTHYKDSPFQDVFGSLWRRTMDEGITVVQPRDLICHVARTAMTMASISVPCYHIQALSRIKTQFELNGWMRDEDGSDIEMQSEEAQETSPNE